MGFTKECILPLCDPEISITEFLLLLNSIYAKANSEKKKTINQRSHQFQLNFEILKPAVPNRMMAQCHGKFKAFKNSRWLVFVCAMWIQSFAGIGYLFGSISPVIKSTMGYSQRQVAILGVAKDLGDAIGFVAGYLSEILPSWVLFAIGAVLNFLGYGLLWLIVSQKIPALPLWVVSSSIKFES